MLKPLMFGFVADDMLGGIAPTIIDTIYYYAMGHASQ